MRRLYIKGERDGNGYYNIFIGFGRTHFVP